MDDVLVEVAEAVPDDDVVVELETEVEVAVGILPKMDKTMAEIFDSAAACTPLHRSRSEPLPDCLFNMDQSVKCSALLLKLKERQRLTYIFRS